VQQGRTWHQPVGRELLVTPASCITGVKWMAGTSSPPRSPLLTTGCSARAKKPSTSHTRNLQQVGYLFAYLFNAKRQALPFSKNSGFSVFGFGIKNLTLVLTVPQTCCNRRFLSVWEDLHPPHNHCSEV